MFFEGFEPGDAYSAKERLPDAEQQEGQQKIAKAAKKLDLFGVVFHV